MAQDSQANHSPWRWESRESDSRRAGDRALKFWDSSALAAYFLREERSEQVRQWLATDSVAVWILTRLELISAVARRRREASLTGSEWIRFRNEINSAYEGWYKVTDVVAVRDRAERLLFNHPLRAADALQLASAILAANGDNNSIEFVTFDRRLGEAAAREGFPVRGV